MIKGTWDVYYEDKEPDRDPDLQQARENDKDALERSSDRLAIASAIPGWVVFQVAGRVTWLTEDIAGVLARDLQRARKDALVPERIGR
jgi:hypothetical protein